MAMKMNLASLASIWCLMACILPGLKGDDSKLQEENDTVVLPCGPHSESFKKRHWYSGYFNKQKTPTDDDLLFKQKKKDSVEKITKRNDMSANGSNFNLTIENVKLEDGHNFTCHIYDGWYNFYYNVNLEVYIQPEITLIVSPEKTIYTEDDNVTVICTIRVYPELISDTFFMKWDTSFHIYPEENYTSNADGSLTYKIYFTKTVSKDDTRVYCLVLPQRGRKRLEKWDFSVQYAPKGRPSIAFTLQSPVQDDFITFLCKTENVTASVISSVTWYKGGSLLDWESTGCCAYTKRADIDDTGNYSCTVGNTLGSSPKSEPRYLNVLKGKRNGHNTDPGKFIAGDRANMARSDVADHGNLHEYDEIRKSAMMDKSEYETPVHHNQAFETTDHTDVVQSGSNGTGTKHGEITEYENVVGQENGTDNEVEIHCPDPTVQEHVYEKLRP